VEEEFQHASSMITWIDSSCVQWFNSTHRWESPLA